MQIPTAYSAAFRQCKVKTLEGITTVTAGAFIGRSITVALKSGEAIEVAEPDESLPRLSVIVPARNEERQIEQCVRSLLQQRYPDFEVIVVDDRSEDRTGEILARLAAEDARLKVVHGQALPEGWVGKPWALQQGAQASSGEWLLFTDADTCHEPLACASAVKYAQCKRADILSLLTTQRFETAAERAVLPTILWMIAFAVGSLEAINDPKRLDAAIFNGQYLLFDRRAYEALGGHGAVRDCIAEDYTFANIVKQDGRFRSRLVGASDLVYTRMYRSLREIWDGFSKNLYVAAENKPIEALIGTAALAALAPVPVALLLGSLAKGHYASAARMGAILAATSLAAEAGMRRSRFPRGSGAYFPLGLTAMLAIFLNSTLQHRSGRVSWRGREYPRRTA